MARFLLMVLMYSPFSASAMNALEPKSCDYKRNFTSSQWEVIRGSFVGAWFTEYRYTLAAISIKESSAGVALINDVTKDYGVYQNNVYTAQRRLKKWRENGRDFGEYDIDNVDDVRKLLIEHETIGRSLAIEELNFWNRSRDGNWMEIWASYNGGYYHNTTREVRATNYANEIKSIVSNLKTCYHDLTKGL